MENFDLVSSLQALPETDPIEIDGIQFGLTCQQGAACFAGTVNVNVQTVCVIGTVC